MIYLPHTQQPAPIQRSLLFFSPATSTTDIYTLSLHDALPISQTPEHGPLAVQQAAQGAKDGAPHLTPDLHQIQGGVALARLIAGDEAGECHAALELMQIRDRKSTRLNSSHRCNSYAVFCLK